jgi:hypothetical protein
LYTINLRRGLAIPASGGYTGSMTNRSKPDQIQIMSRRGKIRPHFRRGWFDLDGFPALIVIAIIVAVRLARLIVTLVWSLLVWITPIVVHYTTGLVLWFRAFYTS